MGVIYLRYGFLTIVLFSLGSDFLICVHGYQIEPEKNNRQSQKNRDCPLTVHADIR